jgi:hypothetical protein
VARFFPIILVLAVIFSGFVGVRDTTAETSPGTVFRAWLTARTDGDVDAQMALLTEDAYYSAGYSWCPNGAPCRDAASIRRELVQQANEHTSITPLAADLFGEDTILVWGELRSDLVRQANVERVIVATTGTVVGDKLSDVRLGYDTSDPETALFVLDRAVMGEHP